MILDEKIESAFKKKYITCVTNFSFELIEYCDAVIETMKEYGDLESMTKKEDFEDLAIQAMLRKATSLSSDYQGEYSALDQAKDIIG